MNSYAILLSYPKKRLIGLVSGAVFVSGAHASDHSLSFRLQCPPSVVALQFDVSSSETVSFGEPAFEGLSPHVVESAVISSGATRFVVYSSSGLAVSESGEVLVTFTSSELSDGMLTVSNVMASDASGSALAASPTALPVILADASAYSSAQVGSSVPLSATAYDLDGSIVELTFEENGTAFSTVFSSAPGNTIWTPSGSGLFQLSVTATDSVGREATLGLGEVRAYELTDLATYPDFESVHFGAAADPSLLGFLTEPYGEGVANGLAWMLGINPNSPDLSLLPSASVEDVAGGQEFVFRFNRLEPLPGVSWSVLESSSLLAGTWSPVDDGWVTQTPAGDGTVDVEVRRPIDTQTEPKNFMNLEANQTP